MREKRTFYAVALMAGYSKILTHIRSDEEKNITCDNQKGIK